MRKQPQGQTLDKFLHPRSSKQIRQHAWSVWQLSGDPLELSEWALRRIEMGLGDELDHKFLITLINIAQNQESREVGELILQLTASESKLQTTRKKERDEAAIAWELRRNEIIRKDNQRRAGSREARSRLERCHNNPPARPRRLTLAERMEKAYRRRRYLLSGT